MQKMTGTEYKAKQSKMRAKHTVAYYDGTEQWNQLPLAISDEVSEPTTVHSNGRRKPSLLVIPSDLTLPETREALFSYVRIGGSAWVTIRDAVTKEKFATIR